MPVRHSKGQSVHGKEYLPGQFLPADAGGSGSKSKSKKPPTYRLKPKSAAIGTTSKSAGHDEPGPETTGDVTATDLPPHADEPYRSAAVSTSDVTVADLPSVQSALPRPTSPDDIAASDLPGAGAEPEELLDIDQIDAMDPGEATRKLVGQLQQLTDKDDTYEVNNLIAKLKGTDDWRKVISRADLDNKLQDVNEIYDGLNTPLDEPMPVYGQTRTFDPSGNVTVTRHAGKAPGAKIPSKSSKISRASDQPPKTKDLPAPPGHKGRTIDTSPGGRPMFTNGPIQLPGPRSGTLDTSPLTGGRPIFTNGPIQPPSPSPTPTEPTKRGWFGGRKTAEPAPTPAPTPEPAAQSDPNTFNLGGVPFHIDPVTKQLTPGAAPAPTPPPEPKAKWYSKSSKDLADRIETYHDEHKHKAAVILKHGEHQIHALRHEAHLEEKSKSLASEIRQHYRGSPERGRLKAEFDTTRNELEFARSKVAEFRDATRAKVLETFKVEDPARRLEIVPSVDPKQPIADTTSAVVAEATEFVSSITDTGWSPPVPMRLVGLPPKREQRECYHRGKIYVGEHTTPGNVIHALGHVLEDRMPGWKKQAQAFLRYRGGEWERPQSLRKACQASDDPVVRASANKYARDEVGVVDNFEDAFGAEGRYVGKKYKDGSTEIISMGLQKLYEDPVKFASRDKEYFFFIVGLIGDSMTD